MWNNGTTRESNKHTKYAHLLEHKMGHKTKQRRRRKYVCFCFCRHRRRQLRWLRAIFMLLCGPTLCRCFPAMLLLYYYNPSTISVAADAAVAWPALQHSSGLWISTAENGEAVKLNIHGWLMMSGAEFFGFRNTQNTQILNGAHIRSALIAFTRRRRQQQKTNRQ